jgi:hypothetical protein
LQLSSHPSTTFLEFPVERWKNGRSNFLFLICRTAFSHLGLKLLECDTASFPKKNSCLIKLGTWRETQPGAAHPQIRNPRAIQLWSSDGITLNRNLACLTRISCALVAGAMRRGSSSRERPRTSEARPCVVRLVLKCGVGWKEEKKVAVGTMHSPVASPPGVREIIIL